MANTTALAAAHRLRRGMSRRMRRLLPVDSGAREVLDLALPAVGEQFLNMTIGLADTFMVGHLGAAAVGAVSMSNTVVMLVTTFFAAVATGVTALVARHGGAHEPEQANQVMHQGYLLGALMGVLFAILGAPLARPIMGLLEAPSDVIGPGSAYLRIVSFSFPLVAWMFVGSAALRGAGDTRTPMLVMLAVNIINIAVAFAAIYGLGPIPALGVAGSAVGAAVGRTAGGIAVVWALWRGRRGLRLRLAQLVPDFRQVKRILNIGLPAGVEQIALRLAQTVFLVTIAGLGTAALAAHQVALQAESLSFMPGFGFAVAATTLAGRGLGAGDPARARADALLAQRLAVLMMSAMGLVFFIFAPQLIALFVNDPEVIRQGVGPLRLEAFTQPGLATLMVLSGGLRGAGDTRMTMWITVAGVWLVRLPVAILLTRPFGLFGAWVGMGLDLNARAFMMWLRFRSDHWTRLRV